MKTILFLLAICAIAKAQLTQGQQDRLRQIADDEILKGDQATLSGIAQSGLILSQLNQLNEYSKVHACRTATKLSINQDESASVLYFKAEIFRFFKCPTLSGVSAEALARLENIKTASNLSLTDSYFMYLIYTHLKDYGVALKPDTFLQDLKDMQSQKWFENFDTRSLSIIETDRNGDLLPKKGLTVEGLYLLQMLSAMMKVETQK